MRHELKAKEGDMKHYYIIDEQGYLQGDFTASKHSEAKYKLMNSVLWPIAKSIKEIARTQVKIYSVSEVYRKW